MPRLYNQIKMLFFLFFLFLNIILIHPMKGKVNQKDNQMNLTLLCRIYGGISFINAVSFVFMTETFLEMAGLTPNPGSVAIAQALGVSAAFIGIIVWRTPDIAGDALASYGQLFGIGLLMFTGVIGYHVSIGIASGPPAYGNLGVNIVLAALFFMYSKKS